MFSLIESLANHHRVEKYRPDTLDDVSGHQDILATINKFVDTNVRDHCQFAGLVVDQGIATTTPASLWPSRNGQNIYNPSIGAKDIWQ